MLQASAAAALNSIAKWHDDDGTDLLSKVPSSAVSTVAGSFVPIPVITDDAASSLEFFAIRSIGAEEAGTIRVWTQAECTEQRVACGGRLFAEASDGTLVLPLVTELGDTSRCDPQGEVLAHQIERETRIEEEIVRRQLALTYTLLARALQRWRAHCLSLLRSRAPDRQGSALNEVP